MYDHHEECNVEARVAKGAKFLDENRPGWRNEVDQSILDLASGSACVVGQLFHNNFRAGLDALGIGDNYKAKNEYGFDCLDHEYTEDIDGYNMNAEYSALTEEWIRVLTAPAVDDQYRCTRITNGQIVECFDITVQSTSRSDALNKLIREHVDALPAGTYKVAVTGANFCSDGSATLVEEINVREQQTVTKRATRSY